MRPPTTVHEWRLGEVLLELIKWAEHADRFIHDEYETGPYEMAQEIVEAKGALELDAEDDFPGPKDAAT